LRPGANYEIGAPLWLIFFTYSKYIDWDFGMSFNKMKYFKADYSVLEYVVLSSVNL